VKVASTIPRLEITRHRYELPCGAVLLVSPRPGSPVTSIRATVRGGSSLDPAGKEGLAYLTGSLLDQGTKFHTEEELANLLEPEGGDVSGDAGGVSGSIASGSWKLLVELVAELLTAPKFPTDAVTRQKERLLARLLVERDDPRSQVAKLFRKLVYGDHWLGRPMYGNLESVSGLAPKDLRAHHRTHWLGKRCIIGVCGDVDPDAVRKLLTRKLAGWKSGVLPKRAPLTFPALGRRFGTFPADRQQVHLYLGHLGIKRKDPDYPALVVMDHILGTGPGFSNRISKRLRDELGLAYSVSADIHSSASLHPGTFTAYIGTSPEHVSTALAGFMDEIRAIQAKKVTKSELELAKSYLLGSFVLGFERASRRANYLVASEVQAFPADELTRLPEKFAAVTAQDVRRVARAHLFPDACCVAASGPLTQKALAGAMPASQNAQRGSRSSSAIPKRPSRKGASPTRKTSR
jgi:zinc protease